MAEIKNKEGYFHTIVRNSYKDEYRSNDNYFKHISSVGDETDIQKRYSQSTFRSIYVKQMIVTYG